MLNQRLQACAAWITDGKTVCDVGTDHAYLAAELLRKERRKMLDDAVKTLPKQRKTVIDMKMEGETNRSISEELKLSEKTVERHITLALSELRNKFRS